MFGGLVPYHQVWNPGANDATTIQVNGNVELNGHTVNAGAYSLWMIPDAKEWTVILNTMTKIDHKPYPGPEKDAVRFAATPEVGAHLENLTFYFPFVDGRKAILRMHWGEVIVPIQVEAIGQSTGMRTPR